MADSKWSKERAETVIGALAIMSDDNDRAYFRENREDMSRDEEEFELCLTQGLGLDEEGTKELVALINGEGWKG